MSAEPCRPQVGVTAERSGAAIELREASGVRAAGLRMVNLCFRHYWPGHKLKILAPGHGESEVECFGSFRNADGEALEQLFQSDSTAVGTRFGAGGRPFRVTALVINDIR